MCRIYLQITIFKDILFPFVIYIKSKLLYIKNHGGDFMYIKKENIIVSMDPKNTPIKHCTSGDTIVFQTLDCYSSNIRNEEDLFHIVDYATINPATGPVYIEGCEPGDILKVDILNIKLDSQGCMALAPGSGPLGEFIKEERTKIIKIEDGFAIFNDVIKIPITPMIGVIGTSPKEDKVLNGTPGEHGSNMDCSKIQEGTSLFLPVNVPGALLSIGDLHAVMGDGEVATCGVEISGEVTIKVDILKNTSIPTPILRTENEYITIASGKTLDQANNAACFKMLKLLQSKLSMDVYEAIMLLSITGNMEICQVVNPLVTARMTMPIWIFEKYGINSL